MLRVDPLHHRVVGVRVGHSLHVLGQVFPWHATMGCQAIQVGQANVLGIVLGAPQPRNAQLGLLADHVVASRDLEVEHQGREVRDGVEWTHLYAQVRKIVRLHDSHAVDRDGTGGWRTFILIASVSRSWPRRVIRHVLLQGRKCIAHRRFG
ncbi:hypothetical protein D3C75_881770 [compost metagenome]